MAVFDLNQLCAAFANAVNAGNLDALCELYASGAVFVTAPGTGAQTVSGSAAVREVLSGLLASRPTMEFEHVYLHQAGDTAVARGKWKLTAAGPDGVAQAVAGNSIEVLRRQPDGSWRYIIDSPWGAE